MLIANRLTVPEGTRALLWDMDGVLLDTLTMDFQLVNRLLSVHGAAEVPRQVIREYFPHDLPQFWRLVLGRVGLQVPQDALDELVRGHERARESSTIRVHDGVNEILADAGKRGLQLAVVSNNPVADVERMLIRAGLRDYFSVVVGNDDPGMAKKPAPDPYRAAARRLAGAAPRGALAAPPVALEDSLLGAQAANAAGCWTVGVATGATDFDLLSASPYVNRCYASFVPCQVVLNRGFVPKKSLVTPTEFVSHMLELITLQLDCSVDVIWPNDDWGQLGRELGSSVAELCRLRGGGTALEAIDDASCRVALRYGCTGDFDLRAASQVNLEWFLGQRCGQLADGQPLVSVLRGLAAGCGLKLEILVVRAGDPYHTWETIFRSIGVGLSRCAETYESVLLSEATPSPTRESPVPNPDRNALTPGVEATLL